MVHILVEVSCEFQPDMDICPTNNARSVKNWSLNQ